MALSLQSGYNKKENTEEKPATAIGMYTPCKGEERQVLSHCLIWYHFKCHFAQLKEIVIIGKMIFLRQ